VGRSATGVGAWGCLLLVGGIIGAGLLGQLAFLAISTGVILLVIFMALYWKATRKTKVWESANPEPKWPLPTLIFKAEPSVLSSPPGSWSTSYIREPCPKARLASCPQNPASALRACLGCAWWPGNGKKAGCTLHEARSPGRSFGFAIQETAHGYVLTEQDHLFNDLAAASLYLKKLNLQNPTFPAA
jgi:hypothetical protein